MKNIPLSQFLLSLFQVVSGLHNDHLCLAVARELERAFGGYVPPFSVRTRE